ncbi:hypothetical protein BC938DRAFT_481655 [Jimgerdemannia flammicorona]|uniref:T-cell immunomodulatory protein TIP C2 domain-containing protein n=1 Tax=Jimgerdemannia flammicorona TaxID=994334 RepID=A0A433QFQ7_9FUNG|nr:hypothetical protein BC938DRAFT_481655 [Jimgerdemannia flammicorona]
MIHFLVNLSSDLIILSSDQYSISVYLWDHVAYNFTPLPRAPQITQRDFVITNVIPGDFNYDGRLDVLVMGQKDTGNPDSEILMRVYLGNGNDSFGAYIGFSDSEYINVHSARKAQPIPFDANGDMKTDLVGYRFGDDAPTVSVWKNLADPKTPNKGMLFDVVPGSTYFNQTDLATCQWTNPHSNAFIDLDGDCLAGAFVLLRPSILVLNILPAIAYIIRFHLIPCLHVDLFFTCEGKTAADQSSYQIWRNAKELGFQKVLSGNLPQGAGPITFADIDGDGSVDMVVPVCYTSGSAAGKCELHIIYNKQVSLCSKSDESFALPSRPPPSSNETNPQVITCRKARDLCVSDPSFNFDSLRLNAADYVVFPLSDVLDGEMLLINDKAFKGILPVPVRAGDYNLDGYPDLLLISSSDSGSTSHVILLESVLCTPNTCSDEAVAAGRRSFVKVLKGAQTLTSITNARAAAFFDIDEDGTLDIMVLQSDDSGTAARNVQPIHNNYFNDAFFLKGLVSNGVCPSFCPTEPKFPDPKVPYGVSYPGATFKFTVLDTSGVKRVQQVSQFSQAAYLSLQTPYMLFGLGRTNNYVEELFAGTTRHQAEHYFFFEGVIPNSQLIFIPYQPAEVKDTSTWKVELYIQPADYVPWVMVILIAAACVLAIVVAVLHWMEKREDELDRRKALHIINFDAL